VSLQVAAPRSRVDVGELNIPSSLIGTIKFTPLVSSCKGNQCADCCSPGNSVLADVDINGVPIAFACRANIDANLLDVIRCS